MLKASLKFFLLFIVACIGAVAIYYLIVPSEDRIPISVELYK